MIRFSISKWLLLLVIGCSGGCGDTSLPYSPYLDSQPKEQISITELKSQLRGSSSSIRQSCYIEGRITANDLFGEFNRSIFVEDSSGGVEILIDHTNLAHCYPLGVAVRVFCEGLQLGDYGGKVILGSSPTGEYIVDRLSERDRELHIHLLNDSPQRIEAQPVTLPVTDRRLVGRFVQVSEVAFDVCCEGLSWCDQDPLDLSYQNSRRHLVSEAGDTLTLFTLGGCLYAKEPLPEGKGSLKGILDYFNGEYQLRVVNRDFQFAR